MGCLKEIRELRMTSARPMSILLAVEVRRRMHDHRIVRNLLVAGPAVSASSLVLSISPQLAQGDSQHSLTTLGVNVRARPQHRTDETYSDWTPNVKRRSMRPFNSECRCFGFFCVSGRIYAGPLDQPLNTFFLHPS